MKYAHEKGIISKIYCYYHFTPCEFATPVISLSIETKWEQVSLALENSPEYSDWC